MSLAGEERVTGLGAKILLLVVPQIPQTPPHHSVLVVGHVARGTTINIRTHVRRPAHHELRPDHGWLQIDVEIKVRLEYVTRVRDSGLSIAETHIAADLRIIL